MAKNGEAEKPLESESEVEDSSEDETQVAKKPSSDSLGPASTVKSHFQRRLWSEEDEMEVLKGMIDKKRNADLNAFHELIKKKLHVDVSRTQLRDKIRKLKRKYMKNKSKEAFLNPHEQRAYELSKKVWGDDGNNTENEKIVMNVEKQRLLATATATATATAVGRIHRFGMMELLFETETETETETEEKAWKKLRMEEMEAHHKVLELKCAQSKLVFDRLLNFEEDH